MIALLVFAAGGTVYAVPVSRVLRVALLGDLADTPPSGALGGRGNHALVLDSRHGPVAVRVDLVTRVVPVPGAALRPPPAPIAAGPFSAVIAPRGGPAVLVVDPDRLVVAAPGAAGQEALP
jgi:chemotaxis signal transduction protein